MANVRLRSCLASTGCAWLAIALLAAPGQPLSAVEFRVQAPRGARATVFERPAVIIATRIASRCESDLSGDRVEFVPNQSPTSFSAGLAGVLRLNGRRSMNPNPLSGAAGEVTIVQSASVPQIELSLGTDYILLLDPAPGVHDPQKSPFYVFAVRQGGFRIDGERRLVPLLRGGELDSYTGRMASDVIEEIQGVRKAVPKPE